jgi:hypothetical protein
MHNLLECSQVCQGYCGNGELLFAMRLKAKKVVSLHYRTYKVKMFHISDDEYLYEALPMTLAPHNFRHASCCI